MTKHNEKLLRTALTYKAYSGNGADMKKQYFVMERRNPNTRPKKQYETDAEFTQDMQWKMHYNTLYDSREDAIKGTPWYGDPECYIEYKVVGFDVDGETSA